MDCPGRRWTMFRASSSPTTNPTEHSSRQPSETGQSSFLFRKAPPFPKEVRPMHRHTWLILVAVAVLAFLPVFAGEHGKCTMSTQDCLDHMAASMKSSGWVGVELQTDNPEGYEVTKVVPGSPAEAAGIAAGDILVELNGVALKK